LRTKNAFLVVAERGSGRHRDGADLETAHRLDVEIARQLPEHLAQQPASFGVEDRLLAVDVEAALFAGRQREPAKRDRSFFEELQ
jgi:hypothetical protein